MQTLLTSWFRRNELDFKIYFLVEFIICWTYCSACY